MDTETLTFSQLLTISKELKQLAGGKDNSAMYAHADESGVKMFFHPEHLTNYVAGMINAESRKQAEEVLDSCKYLITASHRLDNGKGMQCYIYLICVNSVLKAKQSLQRREIGSLINGNR